MNLHQIVPPHPHHEVRLLTLAAYHHLPDTDGELSDVWLEGGKILGLWHPIVITYADDDVDHEDPAYERGEPYIIHAYEHDWMINDEPDTRIPALQEDVRRQDGNYDWYVGTEHCLEARP